MYELLLTLTCIYNCALGDERMFVLQPDAISQGQPYEFESVMHFRHDAFSYNNDNSTIVPINRQVHLDRLGQSEMGTDLDFLHINLFYCGG